MIMVCFCSNKNYGVEECENNLNNLKAVRLLWHKHNEYSYFCLLFWVQAKTYVTTQNPLCLRDASANLTVARLQYGDPFTGEHIEHVPHTEPCKHTQHHTHTHTSFRENNSKRFQTMPLSYGQTAETIQIS